jgi:hypothetical protein
VGSTPRPTRERRIQVLTIRAGTRWTRRLVARMNEHPIWTREGWERAKRLEVQAEALFWTLRALDGPDPMLEYVKGKEE